MDAGGSRNVVFWDCPVGSFAGRALSRTSAVVRRYLQKLGRGTERALSVCQFLAGAALLHRSEQEIGRRLAPHGFILRGAVSWDQPREHGVPESTSLRALTAPWLKRRRPRPRGRAAL